MGGKNGDHQGHKLWSQQGSRFSPHSSAKTNDKTGRMISSCISDVAFASIYSDITCLKKLMVMKMIIIIIIIIIIIMNKLQQNTSFSGRQKLTSAMKLRPEE